MSDFDTGAVRFYAKGKLAFISKTRNDLPDGIIQKKLEPGPGYLSAKRQLNLIGMNASLWLGLWPGIDCVFCTPGDLM